jgi:hypothetical protein
LQNSPISRGKISISIYADRSFRSPRRHRNSAPRGVGLWRARPIARSVRPFPATLCGFLPTATGLCGGQLIRHNRCTACEENEGQ